MESLSWWMDARELVSDQRRSDEPFLQSLGETRANLFYFALKKLFTRYIVETVDPVSCCFIWHNKAKSSHFVHFASTEYDWWLRTHLQAWDIGRNGKIAGDGKLHEWRTVTFQTLHPVISTRSLGATVVLRGHVKFVEILLCQDMTDFVRKIYQDDVAKEGGKKAKRKRTETVEQRKQETFIWQCKHFACWMPGIHLEALKMQVGLVRGKPWMSSPSEPQDSFIDKWGIVPGVNPKVFSMLFWIVTRCIK